MKLNYKLLILTFIFLFNQNFLNAEIHYLDVKYVLTQSEAGKKANKSLKNSLDQGFAKLKDREKKIQGEEKKIIAQKNILSSQEYKKKITELRSKVSSLQKDRNSLLDSISKKRNKANKKLIETLNPILKTYMSEKNIKMILDKKAVLLGDENFDITKDILNRLNKKLTSINLN
jgi:outer membrane protein